MSELEKELDAALDRELSSSRHAPPTKELSQPVHAAPMPAFTERATPLRPVPTKAVTLSEQWDMSQKIQQQLRDRVRQERGMIISEHDRLWTATNSDYDRRIEDAIAKLEADRREAQRTLAGQTAEKLREHDLLTRRME